MEDCEGDWSGLDDICGRCGGHVNQHHNPERERARMLLIHLERACAQGLELEALGVYADWLRDVLGSMRFAHANAERLTLNRRGR